MRVSKQHRVILAFSITLLCLSGCVTSDDNVLVSDVETAALPTDSTTNGEPDTINSSLVELINPSF